MFSPESDNNTRETRRKTAFSPTFSICATPRLTFFRPYGERSNKKFIKQYITVNSLNRNTRANLMIATPCYNHQRFLA
ncbi:MULTISPECIES: hypothetical protein [unclassified Brenneria]|uniref:hypothetical protein n=1 Tax=unclassified Brenneria TaxID=2634434 RepID=UPI001554423B|nr:MULTISPECIES: hypothetical protein [unclassified Brenneria]MBJ7222795.1 hypothetical protein [Brenneria sp. L3-3C-1]MEE3644038.1 hypothetical protein [Brenneria sp. L3_3C_1]MEE3651860.1 hypothetical protein [Brenneria sp. HEZEL_4_2_4]NPD01819.1 hypothetical protein [Brenneria sp. hezel4-2-4]